MPCSTPTTPDDCTSVRSLQGDTKMISSRQRRHTIGWSGGPGSSPVKNQQATNPVSPKKSEKSPQHQPDMLQPPYPNQAVTPSDDMGQGPRKTCCTRPRTADDVMTEIEARKRLKRRSTVKLYAYHANQRLYNNDLLGLGKQYGHMCAGVTKGTFRENTFLLKLYKIFLKKFRGNLLINIVYYVLIDLYIHIYIPNQVIRVATYVFIGFFSLKNTT